jgi:hypothetical protein
MAIGSFLGGGLQGYADEATKRKKAGQHGLLRGRKKKAKPSNSGNTGPVGGGDVIGSFKNGGRVKKTGKYLLHKNEQVVPARKKKRGKRSGKRR